MIRDLGGRWGLYLLLALISGCENTGGSSEAVVPDVLACMESPDTVAYGLLDLQEPTRTEALEGGRSAGEIDGAQTATRAMTPIRRMRVSTPGDPDGPTEPARPGEFDAVVRGGVTEPVIGPVVEFIARGRPMLILDDVLVHPVGSRIYLDRPWWDAECTRAYRLTFLEDGVEIIPR